MTTRRLLFSVITILFCFGLIWVYKLIWGKPASFNLFVERVMVKKAIGDPELLTYLGVVDNTLLDFTSDKLTDISYAKNVSGLQQARDSLDVLHEYSRARLSVQEKLTYDILEHYLQNILVDASFGFGSYVNSFWLSEFTPYPVNQIFGIQGCMTDFMVNIHRVINNKSALNYVARLSQWDKKFADLIAELSLREKNGVIPPLFVIEKVLNELNKYVNVPCAENILFTSFQEKLEKIELSPSKRNSLKEAAFREIETKVYPAHKQLIAFLEGQRSRATQEAGVWKLPNGGEYYLKSLQYHTTTNDSPDEVHALGLSEVNRIKDELRILLDRLGYGEQEVIVALQSMGADPRFLYEDTDVGRAQILTDFRAILESVKEKLPELFSQFPKAELKIEPVPAFRAETSSAYYEPGDLKGTRPGVFFANIYNVKNQTKFTMPTLAFHEGLPGHHFQIALAQEIKGLPILRRELPFNAYHEGWALYCEKLASEYGFSKDPFSDVGRLQFELMRAVRLVVDTGIHWKRWTREQAISYMMENTGMNEDEVVIEIERYIVMPGQACSYKIGMMKILQLRDEMKQRLGADFDIKLFHQIILQNGAMPLTLLENHLRETLAKRVAENLPITHDIWPSLCDWRFSKDEPFDPNSVARGDTIFVEYNLLRGFRKVARKIKHPFIVVTTEDDRPLPSRHHKKLLHIKNVAAWFVMNIDCPASDRIIPVPVGISSEIPSDKLEQEKKRDLFVYLNFNVLSNKKDRQPCWDYFSDKSWVHLASSKPYDEYLDDLSRSVFTISPPGNGIDCYRTWEAICLKCYPVVLSSTLNPLYEDLPVVIVNSWDEVTEEFLKEKKEEFDAREWDNEKLSMAYWTGKLAALQQEIKSQRPSIWESMANLVR